MVGCGVCFTLFIDCWVRLTCMLIVCLRCTKFRGGVLLMFYVASFAYCCCFGLCFEGLFGLRAVLVCVGVMVSLV